MRIWQLKTKNWKSSHDHGQDFFWNFTADSLDYWRILKKIENNPWIRITVLNYTVVSHYHKECIPPTYLVFRDSFHMTEIFKFH